MPYHIKETKPTAADWMALRASVGWAAFPEDVANKSLDATPYCVCAFEGDRLVGMGRVLGDSVFTFYIGNVMVAPDYQGKGIGRDIMEVIMHHVDSNAYPGAIASLLSISGFEDFYKQFGFTERPHGERGSGMSKHY